MAKRPGGELATRPLHFIFLCDGSGSMGVDGKIQALNTAIREATPHMRKAADENPNAQVLVRAVRFSSGAAWHIEQPVPVDSFIWKDMDADGVTDLGRALTLLSDALRIPPMTERALPPVLVLLSDGQPTDDWETGLQTLLGLPWGKRAVRIAIAIGNDADMDVLKAFVANPEIQPLPANNPEKLIAYIKWVSTVVLGAASSPPSQAEGERPVGNVPIPEAPEVVGTDLEDVW